MSFHVYVLTCADGSLYTGVATDIARRLEQHNGVRTGGARYTSRRRPVTLAYAAPFPDRSAAQREEARIKRLSRAEKLALIATGGQIEPSDAVRR